MSILRPLLPALLVAAALSTASAGASDGLAAPAPAPDAPSSSAHTVCADEGPVPVSALGRRLPCDLTGRVVAAGGARVVVPPPGYGVAARGASASGEQSLTVENAGGVVTATVGGADRPVAGGRTSAPLPACEDRAFNLYGKRHSWARKLRWSYNDRGQTRAIPAGHLVKAIKRAGVAMAGAKNDCGIEKDPRASIGFGGRTKARPGIKGNAGGATCRTSNGRNTVGWGTIGGDSDGWTCIWWGPSGRLTEADMLLDPGASLAIGVSAGCTATLDLQALATHEWGHAFGLDHVDYGKHANLVMPHWLEWCSIDDRTLGLGDYLGLKKLYGVR